MSASYQSQNASDDQLPSPFGGAALADKEEKLPELANDDSRWQADAQEHTVNALRDIHTDLANKEEETLEEVNKAIARLRIVSDPESYEKIYKLLKKFQDTREDARSMNAYRHWQKLEPLHLRQRKDAFSRTILDEHRACGYDCNHESETCQCSVCYAKFTDVYTTLPCGHTFHYGCIMRWLIRTNSCPMCRHDNLQAVDEDLAEQARDGEVELHRGYPTWTEVYGWCDELLDIAPRGLIENAAVAEEEKKGEGSDEGEYDERPGSESDFYHEDDERDRVAVGGSAADSLRGGAAREVFGNGSSIQLEPGAYSGRDSNLQRPRQIDGPNTPSNRSRSRAIRSTTPRGDEHLRYRDLDRDRDEGALGRGMRAGREQLRTRENEESIRWSRPAYDSFPYRMDHEASARHSNERGPRARHAGDISHVEEHTYTYSRYRTTERFQQRAPADTAEMTFGPSRRETDDRLRGMWPSHFDMSGPPTRQRNIRRHHSPIGLPTDRQHSYMRNRSLPRSPTGVSHHCRRDRFPVGSEQDRSPADAGTYRGQRFGRDRTAYESPSRVRRNHRLDQYSLRSPHRRRRTSRRDMSPRARVPIYRGERFDRERAAHEPPIRGRQDHGLDRDALGSPLQQRRTPRCDLSPRATHFGDRDFESRDRVSYRDLDDRDLGNRHGQLDTPLTRRNTSRRQREESPLTDPRDRVYYSGHARR